MKYLRLLIIIFAITTLLGCSTGKDIGPVSENNSVRVEQVKPESNKGHFLIYVLLIAGVCGSVVYTYSVSNELREYKRKNRNVDNKAKVQEKEIPEEVICNIKNDVYRALKDYLNKEIEEIKQKVDKIKISSYSRNDSEKPLQQSHHQVSYIKRETFPETFAAPRDNLFKDDVDEYNYYINSAKILPNTFVELKDYVADNGRLVERTTGEALLYIADNHVFPSRKISDTIALSWVCDAFNVIGKGKNIFVEQPCTVRKMNKEYEVVEKGIVKLN